MPRPCGKRPRKRRREMEDWLEWLDNPVWAGVAWLAWLYAATLGLAAASAAARKMWKKRNMGGRK